jgi:hypothetical protein
MIQRCVSRGPAKAGHYLQLKGARAAALVAFIVVHPDLGGSAAASPTVKRDRPD